MAGWLSSTLGKLALSGEAEFLETADSFSSTTIVVDVSVAVGTVVEVGDGGGGKRNCQPISTAADRALARRVCFYIVISGRIGGLKI